MDAKIKAKELFEKFIPLTMKWHPETGWSEDESDAQSCALITVDELINSSNEFSDPIPNSKKYWQEVKNEINKLYWCKTKHLIKNKKREIFNKLY